MLNASSRSAGLPWTGHANLLVAPLLLSLVGPAHAQDPPLTFDASGELSSTGIVTSPSPDFRRVEISEINGDGITDALVQEG